MKRLKFKCKFLTDVILNAQTATEGAQETLDYIPGSNFLGIVAKQYDKLDSEVAYKIFHSGDVCFGDAHLALDNEKSFKAPLSWFTNKGEGISDEKWVHHGLNDDIRKDLTKDDKQLKQVRAGWITKDGQQLRFENNFAIKAAYDRDKRTSADGRLFGYHSLQAGLEWIFYVDIEDDIDTEFITKNLIGERSIGRSRSAQYGRVKITKISEGELNTSDSKTFQINDRHWVAIYAESRLAFFDDYGQPTLQPTAEQLGFNGWTIEWGLSQIKSKVFAPWNGIVGGRLADRVCVEKGSVFILSNANNQSIPNSIKVGAFKNEGFGNVLISPEILSFDPVTGKSKFIVKDIDNSDSNENTFYSSIKNSDNKSDDNLNRWLNIKSQEQQRETEIFKDVRKFAKENGKRFKASSSQWGQVRERAAQAKNYDELVRLLFKPIETTSDDGIARSKDRANSGFLMHGKMGKIWGKSVHILEKELEKHKKFGTDYAERLAAQMQKVSKKNSQTGDDNNE